jgi:hypothetical protein
MKRKTRGWNRLLWGIKFCGTPLDDPMLIGDAWDRSPRSGHFGEPTRTLLFNTRDQARAWCDVQNAKNMARTDCCAGWRFSPVRVREIVKLAGYRAARRSKP